MWISVRNSLVHRDILDWYLSGNIGPMCGSRWLNSCSLTYCHTCRPWVSLFIFYGYNLISVLMFTDIYACDNTWRCCWWREVSELVGAHIHCATSRWKSSQGVLPLPIYLAPVLMHFISFCLCFTALLTMSTITIPLLDLRTEIIFFLVVFANKQLSPFAMPLQLLWPHH